MYVILLNVYAAGERRIMIIKGLLELLRAKQSAICFWAIVVQESYSEPLTESNRVDASSEWKLLPPIRRRSRRTG